MRGPQLPADSQSCPEAITFVPSLQAAGNLTRFEFGFRESQYALDMVRRRSTNQNVRLIAVLHHSLCGQNKKRHSFAGVESLSRVHPWIETQITVGTSTSVSMVRVLYRVAREKR